MIGIDYELCGKGYEMGDDLAKNRNFSLYPEQEAILIQVAKDNGLGNLSAALRMVISDWVRLRAEKDGVKVPFVPSEAEAVV